MSIVRLKDKFEEAAAGFKDQIDSIGGTTLIHRTPWVRILLEQNEQDGDVLTLEVEISLPKNNDFGKLEFSEIIDTLVEHLQYLQRLREVGFKLSVIGTGCIYCASKELHIPPEDNLIRALIPPETE